MTTSKLPSGKYRTRIYIDGKQVSFTAETKRESMRLANQAMNMRTLQHITIMQCVDSYIESKENMLSPATIREYKNTRKYFEPIAHIKTDKIKRADIQKFVSDLSINHSPKTVKNIYGVLSASLDLICDLRFKIDLPQKQLIDYNIPSEREFQLLIENASPELRKCILLAGIGTLRRGEISALTFADLNGNDLHVHSCMVKDEFNEWVIKQPKTTTSNRHVILPSFVVDLLGNGKQDAHIVSMLPVSITDAFCDLRDSLGLHCRFHDLRHYSISLAHSLGIPDKVMMDKSGICNDSTFKKIYRNTIEADAKTYNDLLNEYFEQKIKADV